MVTIALFLIFLLIGLSSPGWQFGPNFRNW